MYKAVGILTQKKREKARGRERERDRERERRGGTLGTEIVVCVTHTAQEDAVVDLLFFFPSFSVYLTFSFFLYALWDLFGQLTLMLPPAQMHISCDEPTACWIFPQISHAVG